MIDNTPQGRQYSPRSTILPNLDNTLVTYIRGDYRVLSYKKKKISCRRHSYKYCLLPGCSLTCSVNFPGCFSCMSLIMRMVSASLWTWSKRTQARSFQLLPTRKNSSTWRPGDRGRSGSPDDISPSLSPLVAPAAEIRFCCSSYFRFLWRMERPLAMTHCGGRKTSSLVDS